ncbi:MAG: Txe/YoeB family addiction module toxin [Flavobacteriia bacterium]|jgi:toxin YoeB
MTYKFDLTTKAKNDIEFFKKSGNTQILSKVFELINSIVQTPYSGIGKPEALKHQFSGLWSRRINKEHRLIYEVLENEILIHSLKGHY